MASGFAGTADGIHRLIGGRFCLLSWSRVCFCIKELLLTVPVKSTQGRDLRLDIYLSKMTKITRTTVKKYARVAYTRFDMCVSTIFSPFAGVLYTVSAFEKGPEKPSRPGSRTSTASSSSSSSGSSRSSSRSSTRDEPPSYSYDV